MGHRWIRGPAAEWSLLGSLPTSGVFGTSVSDVRVVGWLQCRFPYLACMVPRADLAAVSLCVSRRFVASLCVEPEKGTRIAKAGEAEVEPGPPGPPRPDRRGLASVWLGAGQRRPHHHFLQRDGATLSSAARRSGPLSRSVLVPGPRRAL